MSELENNQYISKNNVDVGYRIPDNELCIGKWKLEKITNTCLSDKLKRGSIKGEKIKNQWYIPKSEVEMLMKNISIPNSCYLNINFIREISDYMNVSQVSKILNIGPEMIRNMIRNGIIEAHEVLNENHTVYYINEYEVARIKGKIDEYNDKAKFFTSKDVPHLFGIDERSFLRSKRINKIIKKPEFFCNRNYYHVTDTNKIRKVLSSKRRIQSDEHISLVEATKILNMYPDSIARLLNEGYLPNSYSYNYGSNLKNYLISTKDLNEFKNKFFFLYDENYITANRGKDLFDVGYTAIKVNLSEKCYEFLGTKYYHVNDVKKVANYFSLKNELYLKVVKNKDKNSAYEYFKLLYLYDVEVDPNITESVELYKNYFLDTLKISKSNNLNVLVNNIGCLLEYLIEKLKEKQKEIYKFNNFEIEELVLNKAITNRKSIELGKFSNYVRSNLKGSCNYDKTFVRKYTPTNKEKDYYDFETFIEYGKYVANIDLHISNALNSSRYAQVWLYIIMHFCTAWRSGNILDMPSIDLDIIDINELEWFKTHRLSITQCEMIIRKYEDNDYIANKTRNKIPFQVFKLFKECFATSVIICEIHRMKSMEDKLLFNFQVYAPYKKDYNRFFSNSSKLESFSSLMANRSILTNFYYFTNNKTEFQKIAYFLSRKLRGHVTDDMTAVYIHNLDKNEEIETASKFIFDNEIFGFIKYMMAEVIALSQNIEFDKLSMEEKRKLIENLNNDKSIHQIEGYSKSLLIQQNKEMLIINEILNMERDNIISMLQKIYQGLMPSCIRECQCFKYPNCVHGDILNPSCEKCQYLIPNKHFLIALNIKINDTIDKLIELKLNNKKIEFLKTSSYLNRLIELLNEALDERIGLGNQVVNAYIDYDEILKKITKLYGIFLEEYEEKTSAIHDLIYKSDLNLSENINKVYKYAVPLEILEIYNLFCLKCNQSNNLSVYIHILVTLEKEINKNIDEVRKFKERNKQSYLFNLLKFLREVTGENSIIDDTLINSYINRAEIYKKLVEMQKIIEEE